MKRFSNVLQWASNMTGWITRCCAILLLTSVSKPLAFNVFSFLYIGMCGWAKAVVRSLARLNLVYLATTMHCNLRSPGVAPVVLGFITKPLNALAYKFDNFATIPSRTYVLPTKFLTKPTIRGWVIDHCTNFPGQVFRGNFILAIS